MNLTTIKYTNYERNLPQEGRHIIGQVQGENIVVYQAFNPQIAKYAVKNQQFGGSHYKFSRMSWIKPNFLWMMYRAGWAEKENQERILAIQIKLTNFILLLKEAVHSSFKSDIYQTHENWKSQLSKSNVRLQWDPDHDPHGNKLNRRAIQLGMNGRLLQQFATEWICSIEDITPFVAEQKKILDQRKMEDLEVIAEQEITIEDRELIDKLRLDY
ncbi:MAG: DUF4291 domain-containing protein [Bacteroidia bacterium]